VINDEPMKVLQ